jgi:hypothetical protein
MQALNSFISPVPNFDGEIPILAIPYSARPPNNEPMSDPPTGANASASKTQVGKQKASANPTPQKKGQEIDEHAPKAPSIPLLLDRTS